MNQTSQYPIPEPIGGLPDGVYDFVVNLLFCIGFAIAFGTSVFHQFNPRRRTSLLVSTRAVAVERMVVTSMRMAASLRTNVRESWGITEYMQIALSAGYITLSEEQLYLLVCAVTQATREGMTYDDWKQLAEKDPSIKVKRRQEREKYRKWACNFDWFARTVQWIQIVIYFRWADGSKDIALIINCIRFFGNLASLVIIASLLAMVYRVREVEHLNQAAVRKIKLTLTILLFVPLFRTTVSFRTATSSSTSPLSALPAKVAFYLFHLLPELLSCFITAWTDYPALCDTGKWGDHPRWREEYGMPEIPTCIVTLGYIFRPWKWPGLFRNHFFPTEEPKAIIQSSDSSLYSNEGCEKVLPSSSMGKWQASIETSTIFSSRLDEKESIRSQPLSTSSRAWSNFDSSKSFISNSTPVEAKLLSTPSPLVTDVNLWRPRASWPSKR